MLQLIATLTLTLLLSFLVTNALNIRQFTDGSAWTGSTLKWGRFGDSRRLANQPVTSAMQVYWHPWQLNCLSSFNIFAVDLLLWLCTNGDHMFGHNLRLEEGIKCWFLVVLFSRQPITSGAKITFTLHSSLLSEPKLKTGSGVSGCARRHKIKWNWVRIRFSILDAIHLVTVSPPFRGMKYVSENKQGDNKCSL